MTLRILKNIIKFDSILMGFYISGLEKISIKRRTRKLIARTKIHRAWISGKIERFSEKTSSGFIEHGICGYRQI